jgi:squalene synthase HpnC
LANEFLLPRDFLRSPAEMGRTYSPAEAALYTRWLAAANRDAFRLAGVVLSRQLHQDFANLHAFCRWTAELGGGADRQENLRLLEWWRGLLVSMQARTAHPVSVALAGTASRHALPIQLFHDLIHASQQDQQVGSYATWTELYDYCRYAANPVGRLALMLCGHLDEERFSLSDSTSTALRLTGFWRDVAADLRRGRVYIPIEVLRRHRYTLEELRALRFTPAFREVMREAVGLARGLFEEGLPLVRRVGRRLALGLDLLSRAGLAVLDRIAAADYNVLAGLPAVSSRDHALLIPGSLARVAFRGAA